MDNLTTKNLMTHNDESENDEIYLDAKSGEVGNEECIEVITTDQLYPAVRGIKTGSVGGCVPAATIQEANDAKDEGNKYVLFKLLLCYY